MELEFAARAYPIYLIDKRASRDYFKETNNTQDRF